MTEFGKKNAADLLAFVQRLNLPEPFAPVDLAELILLLNEMDVSRMVRDAEIDAYYKTVRPKDRWEHPFRRVVAPHHLQSQELYFRLDIALTGSRDIMRGLRPPQSRGAHRVLRDITALQHEMIQRRRKAAGELA